MRERGRLQSVNTFRLSRAAPEPPGRRKAREALLLRQAAQLSTHTLHSRMNTDTKTSYGAARARTHAGLPVRKVPAAVRTLKAAAEDVSGSERGRPFSLELREE